MSVKLDIAYTFEQAVGDGVLLDVSDLAAGGGLEGAEVFISVGLWDDEVIAREVDVLRELLARVGFALDAGERALAHDGKVVVTYPRTFEQGGDVRVRCRVFAGRRHRPRIVLLVDGEVLDFRMVRTVGGGSFFVQ